MVQNCQYNEHHIKTSKLYLNTTKLKTAHKAYVVFKVSLKCSCYDMRRVFNYDIHLHIQAVVFSDTLHKTKISNRNALIEIQLGWSTETSTNKIFYLKLQQYKYDCCHFTNTKNTYYTATNSLVHFSCCTGSKFETLYSIIRERT